MERRPEDLGLGSIQDINGLAPELVQACYLQLVPRGLLDQFGIDPITLLGRAGERLVRITSPTDKPWGRVEVRASRDDRDPLLLIDVEMSPLAVPELAFVQITDPAGPRYAIDRDEDGLDTLYGTISRNVPEELRAMKDGLAPGQVRRGLRMLGSVLESMERFCRLIGKEIYLIEPLFYHSAILYERHGCGYLMGREIMEEIQAGFAPGGVLLDRLDCASAFRAPSAAQTVRGRSWALHDGVAEGAWGGVKMYKAAGRRASVNTFPGSVY